MPIMGLIMFMAVNPTIMGKFVISMRLRVGGWLATAAMGAAGVAMLWFMFS
jgi:Mn2+/Fe2+ NRAMP family transporter